MNIRKLVKYSKETKKASNFFEKIRLFFDIIVAAKVVFYLLPTFSGLYNRFLPWIPIQSPIFFLLQEVFQKFVWLHIVFLKLSSFFTIITIRKYNLLNIRRFLLLFIFLFLIFLTLLFIFRRWSLLLFLSYQVTIWCFIVFLFFFFIWRFNDYRVGLFFLNGLFFVLGVHRLFWFFILDYFFLFYLLLSWGLFCCNYLRFILRFWWLLRLLGLFNNWLGFFNSWLVFCWLVTIILILWC